MPLFENPGEKIDPVKTLQELFKADQKDRSSGLLAADERLFLEKEGVRYRKVQELYAFYESDPSLFSGEMKFDLAILFHHGTSTEDYEKALQLARAAEQDSFGGAETLVKAAEDRYLLSLGEPQRWGTQTLKNERLARADYPLIKWVRPDVESENGEIERVSEAFAPDRKSIFQEQIKRALAQAQLVDLDEAAWNILENTDSMKITKDGFDQVERFALEYGRDEKILLKVIQDQGSMEAPMILRMGSTLHLISGNTRLMISRALGQIPKVLIADIQS